MLSAVKAAFTAENSVYSPTQPALGSCQLEEGGREEKGQLEVWSPSYGTRALSLQVSQKLLPIQLILSKITSEEICTICSWVMVKIAL